MTCSLLWWMQKLQLAFITHRTNTKIIIISSNNFYIVSKYFWYYYINWCRITYFFCYKIFIYLIDFKHYMQVGCSRLNPLITYILNCIKLEDTRITVSKIILRHVSCVSFGNSNIPEHNMISDQNVLESKIPKRTVSGITSYSLNVKLRIFIIRKKSLIPKIFSFIYSTGKSPFLFI